MSLPHLVLGEDPHLLSRGRIALRSYPGHQKMVVHGVERAAGKSYREEPVRLCQLPSLVYR
jgi:hypothetical protein